MVGSVVDQVRVFHPLSNAAYTEVVFTTTFGPGGFRTTRMGGGFPRPNAARPQDTRSVVMQLMPLILLFAISVLTNLPNLLSTPPVPDPRFTFRSSARYNAERTTGDHGINYYVNPSDLTSHPVLGAELAKLKAQTPQLARGPAVTKFERNVEVQWTQEMYEQCTKNLRRKEQRRDAEIGLFGIGVDWNKVKGASYRDRSA